MLPAAPAVPVALVVFYSGHADAEALHLGPTDLPFDELRGLGYAEKLEWFLEKYSDQDHDRAKTDANAADSKPGPGRPGPENTQKF